MLLIEPDRFLWTDQLQTDRPTGGDMLPDILLQSVQQQRADALWLICGHDGEILDVERHTAVAD